jgi:uncharacterized protein (DUF58 family)
MIVKTSLDPQFVSQLQSLELKAKCIVEGFLSGLHKSPYHGFSVEFTEYRPYIPGEGIRYLDWKQYAKSDRLVIREYEENTNLKACLLLDTSASMAYASGNNISKFQYAVLLAASLSYLLLHQRDATGLFCRDSEGRRQFVHPRSSRGQLFRILGLLQKAGVWGKEPLAPDIHRVAERMGRKGLVVILSDLMEDPEPLLTGVKHLRYLGHEVIVFYVLDPSENAFDFAQNVLFEDMETSDHLQLNPLRIAAEYREKLLEHSGLLSREFLKQKVDFEPVVTSQPFDKALKAFLQKRSQIHYA